MNGLVLKLAPGERLLINGAVIENGDRRTRLTLVTPGAHVLRLRDALHPEDANTPVKRVCYIAQLAVAGETEAAEAQRQLESGVAQLLDVFTDGESRAALTSARNHAREGRFYPALRSLRTLIPHEETLLAAAAAPSAPRQTEASAAR